MAINFPTGPANQDIHTENGITYQYWSNTTAWIAVPQPRGGGFYQGNSGNVGGVLGLADIFRVHSNTMTENVTICTGNNALASGPLTINTNRFLTIQANARVSIV